MCHVRLPDLGWGVTPRGVPVGTVNRGVLKMPITAVSEFPSFDIELNQGVLLGTVNVSAAALIGGHMRAEIARQKQAGRYVADCLIAFAEQLTAASRLAALVQAGEAKPTDFDVLDEIEATTAPVFSIGVNEEGEIEVDATTKMGYLVSRLLRDYRDWNHDRGLALPGVVSAFGAEIGKLARAGRPLGMPRPIARLPEEETTRAGQSRA
jgi:hypothetical protein